MLPSAATTRSFSGNYGFLFRSSIDVHKDFFVAVEILPLRTQQGAKGTSVCNFAPHFCQTFFFASRSPIIRASWYLSIESGSTRSENIHIALLNKRSTEQFALHGLHLFSRHHHWLPSRGVVKHIRWKKVEKGLPASTKNTQKPKPAAAYHRGRISDGGGRDCCRRRARLPSLAVVIWALAEPNRSHWTNPEFARKFLIPAFFFCSGFLFSRDSTEYDRSVLVRGYSHTVEWCVRDQRIDFDAFQPVSVSERSKPFVQSVGSMEEE